MSMPLDSELSAERIMKSKSRVADGGCSFDLDVVEHEHTEVHCIEEKIQIGEREGQRKKTFEMSQLRNLSTCNLM